MTEFLNLKKVTALHAQAIRQAVCRVTDSGWYLKGVETSQFEEQYARYIGTRHCIGVGNGLDALTLIFRAYIEMGVMAKGDEVIVPANTYIASILAVSECGLRPVLVEPRQDTLLIDDRLIGDALSERTRAVMIVHLYGRCAYTPTVRDLCRRHGLKLIEDNAQAHGCRAPQTAGASAEASRRTGSLGDAAGHSFYPGKNLGALGDAGAVTTDDDQLAAIVRSLGNYGSSQKYVFDYLGRNSRLDELQAAVLSAKLPYLDEDNRHRQLLAAYYYDHLSHPEVTLPQRLPDAENVYHLFPVLCQRRDDLQAYLAERGIQTLIHYPIPPHQQRCYHEWNGMSLPITEAIHKQELSLPISPAMTPDEIKTVVEAVNDFPRI